MHPESSSSFTRIIRARLRARRSTISGNSTPLSATSSNSAWKIDDDYGRVKPNPSSMNSKLGSRGEGNRYSTARQQRKPSITAYDAGPHSSIISAMVRCPSTTTGSKTAFARLPPGGRTGSSPGASVPDNGAAAIMSRIPSAKLNGHDPFVYLKSEVLALEFVGAGAPGLDRRLVHGFGAGSAD